MARFIIHIVFVFFVCTSSGYAQDALHFTILHTNDEHSNLIAHPVVDYHPTLANPALGGFARLGGLIQKIRSDKESAGEPVLLFSGGDIIGGPAFGWLALKGYAAELDLMQMAGYDGIVLGNHEFDFGTNILASYLSEAGYPDAHSHTAVLGTNFIIPDDHQLSVAEIQHTVIKTLNNGLKVGYFGLLGEDAISKTAFPDPVTFTHYTDAARIAVDELMAAEVDVIIAITHSGQVEDVDLAQRIPEIDVIVGGHFHTALYEPIIVGKTIIVQAGSYLRYLGQIELSWLPEEQRVLVRNNENNTPFLIPVDDTSPVHPEIAERVQWYETELNKIVDKFTDGTITGIRQTIATSPFSLSALPPKTESNLGNFITDALRIVSEKETGIKTDVAVQANGAIRGHVNPGTMPWSENDISFYDLVLTTGLGSGLDGNPGYPVVAFYLTGSEIRRAMEISVLLSEIMANNYFIQFSGAGMEYDPGRALWLRVPVTGTPIPSLRSVRKAWFINHSDQTTTQLNKGDDQLYRVVTDYYIASFLPQVGRLLPQLDIQFKDASGNPIALDDAVILKNGEELKVWQAVVSYAMMHTTDNSISKIPSSYQEAGYRLVIVNMYPLWILPLVIIILLSIIIFFLIRRFRPDPKQ
jgi:UDP-sugar diphosphatase